MATVIYDARVCVDSGMASIGLYSNLDDAIAAVSSGKGQWQLQPYCAEVQEVVVSDSPDSPTTRNSIWGYRKSWNGKWAYGYLDNRDEPLNDPDYIVYLQMKAKFDIL